MFIRRILSTNLFYTSLQKSYTSIKNDTARPYNVLVNDDIPEVSPSIIKKALSSANITFEEGNTCFIVPCSVCCKSSKAAPKLYINTMTGNFSCTCGNLGQWKTFEQYFINKRRKKLAGSIEPFVDTGKLETSKSYLSNIESSTKKLSSLSEENVIAIFKRFNLPNVPMSALSNLAVRIDSNQSKLYFPLENVESRTVGYRVLSVENKTKRSSNTCT
ncbi:uncharacterized protein LOC108738342 [Agrilus planipennis]|uniref:Uncharacterized protein LOC108738342 n=1 Tax=Agrilus planipennis TaxID=224129 RepID=A0A1W4X4G5_AGRPL|nr:uncharacterized protein LOC108738342 [Agrilus planipennis]